MPSQNPWGRVLVATRYQPQCSAHFTASLVRLVESGLRAGDQRASVFSKTMHKAANLLVRDLLKSDCDSILFVDSDAVFDAQALEALRSDPRGFEYDMLQAFTVKRGWPPEPMYLTAWVQQPRGPEAMRGLHMRTNLPLEDDSYFQVDAVSLHFTLIRRSLFEQLVEPEGPDYTYWFEYNRDNGEDITFSRRALQAGARMAMTTHVKIGHDSNVVTGWDTMIDYYDRKVALQGGAPPPSLERLASFFQARAALASLVAEYLKEPPEHVYELAEQGDLLLREHWLEAAPVTAEAVRKFYGEAREYLYDLVKWNSSPAFQRLLSCLADVRGERVLDFGGGIGTASELLAVHGNDVYYYDLPSPVRDFSRWRFSRLNGCAPTMPEDWQAHAPYDRIVAIDVLEHVHPGEFASTLRQLIAALKPGSKLFAHSSWSNAEGTYPQHYDHSSEFARILQDTQMERLDEFTWRKP